MTTLIRFYAIHILNLLEFKYVYNSVIPMNS